MDESQRETDGQRGHAHQSPAVGGTRQRLLSTAVSLARTGSCSTARGTFGRADRLGCRRPGRAPSPDRRKPTPRKKHFPDRQSPGRLCRSRVRLRRCGRATGAAGTGVLHHQTVGGVGRGRVRPAVEAGVTDAQHQLTGGSVTPSGQGGRYIQQTKPEMVDLTTGHKAPRVGEKPAERLVRAPAPAATRVASP